MTNEFALDDFLNICKNIYSKIFCIVNDTGEALHDSISL